MALGVQFWRKWHRWIGFPAALFLVWAAATGMLVAGTEFFGADEALREATRQLVSPLTSAAASSEWTDPMARAIAALERRAPGTPIDKIEVQLKGEQPTVTLYTGKRTGGEDRKLVFHARTGTLLSDEAYADKPFLYRLHSGEAFGDGGLVGAMLWGLTLVVLTVSGLVIYLQMRRPNLRGWRRLFW